MTIELVSLSEVNHFIIALKLPCELANQLLHTMEDCELFEEKFHKTNARPTDDLLDYREHKIATSGITLESFLSSCNLAVGLSKAVFEQTFFEDFCDEDMEKIASAVINHKVSLEQLFLSFQKMPNKRIIAYVI